MTVTVGWAQIDGNCDLWALPARSVRPLVDQGRLELVRRSRLVNTGVDSCPSSPSKGGLVRPVSDTVSDDWWIGVGPCTTPSGRPKIADPRVYA